jgi:hypothetical protein
MQQVCKVHRFPAPSDPQTFAILVSDITLALQETQFQKLYDLFISFGFLFVELS